MPNQTAPAPTTFCCEEPAVMDGGVLRCFGCEAAIDCDTCLDNKSVWVTEMNMPGTCPDCGDTDIYYDYLVRTSHSR